MLEDKHTVIVSTDFLQAYGLKELLVEYFSANSIELLNDLAAVENHPLQCDILFLQADILFAFFDKLSTIRSKLIVIANGTIAKTDISALNTRQEQSTLIDALNDLLEEKLHQQKERIGKSALSEREQEVLTLIAKGEMNKTIADKLNISLNTVLTHRKNITAKLNIKTISGLTVYAILNGLISAEEV